MRHYTLCFFSFGLLCFATGCGSERYATKLFLQERHSEDPEVETFRAVISSNRVWDADALRAFPESHAEIAKIRNSIRFGLTGKTSRGLPEVELSFSARSPDQAERFREALVGAFNRHMREFGAKGDYLIKEPISERSDSP